MIRDDSINRGTTLVAAVKTICRFFVIELQTDLPFRLTNNLSAIDCLSVRILLGGPVSSTLFAYLVVICTRPLYKESLEMSRLSWVRVILCIVSADALDTGPKRHRPFFPVLALLPGILNDG